MLPDDEVAVKEYLGGQIVARKNTPVRL